MPPEAGMTVPRVEISKATRKVVLSIETCPLHETWVISLTSLDAGYSSIRLTPDKCCGRSQLVKEFTVDADDVINEIECAAE